MAEFKERLKMAMDIRRIRQIDLAEQTELNPGTINNYLKGKYVPRNDKVYMLAKVLKVNPAWLLGYDVPMEYEKIELPNVHVIEVEGSKNVIKGGLESENKLLNELFEYLKLMNVVQLSMVKILCQSLLESNNLIADQLQEIALKKNKE